MLDFFDSLFDFDGNGSLDFFEETCKWSTFAMGIDEMQKAEKKKRLQSAGLDVDKLKWMTDFDRNLEIINAGLSPEYYTDLF